MAQIQHAERADVPVEYVLGIGGFDLERVDTEVRCLQCLLLQQDAYLIPDTSCVLITGMHMQHCVCKQ